MTTQAETGRLAVCASEDVPEGGRLVLDVAGATIAIFRLHGRLHCYDNICPHRGGPVCQGLVIGAVDEQLAENGATLSRRFDEDDLRIVCPWHGFEFSIATGLHPSAPQFALTRRLVDEYDGVVHVAV